MNYFIVSIGILLAVVLFVSPAFQQRVSLLSVPILYAARGAATIVSAPITLFQGIGHLREELKNLQDEIILLRAQVANLQIAKRENELLRQQLGTPIYDRFGKNVFATIVGRDPVNGDLTIIVDAGRRDGIQKDNPVVAPGGVLIGRVISVGDFGSIVQLISHAESRIDVRILPANIRGVVQSHGGFLSIDVLPQRFSFQDDESVTTTGADGLYPAGLYMGELGEVLSQEVDVFERRRLNNDQILEKLTEVFILVQDIQ